MRACSQWACSAIAAVAAWLALRTRRPAPSMVSSRAAHLQHSFWPVRSKAGTTRTPLLSLLQTRLRFGHSHDGPVHAFVHNTQHQCESAPRTRPWNKATGTGWSRSGAAVREAAGGANPGPTIWGASSSSRRRLRRGTARCTSSAVKRTHAGESASDFGGAQSTSSSMAAKVSSSAAERASFLLIHAHVGTWTAVTVGCSSVLQTPPTSSDAEQL